MPQLDGSRRNRGGPCPYSGAVRRYPKRLGVVVVAVAVSGGAGSLAWSAAGPATAGAARVVDKCANPDPPMPPSTCTETPSGFAIQMSGAELAPASQASTLAAAYAQFNDMHCTIYTHHYRYQPPY